MIDEEWPNLPLQLVERVDDDADAASVVDVLQELFLLRPQLFAGPLHLDGEQVAERHRPLVPDDADGLGQHAEDVGDALQPREPTVAAVLGRDGALVLTPRPDALPMQPL